MESLPEVYPLTGLQMGDIQCYLSWSFLYFAPESKRFLILVDNRPWSLKKHSRSTKLWQFMVTKYKMSPFINTRALLNNTDHTKFNERNGSSRSNFSVSKRFHRWYAVIDAAKWQKKYLLSVMELTKALQGLLVFEVSWKDVYGINYLNELQTDTCLALEVRFMKKWEFLGPEQASRCISSWFSGTRSETLMLMNSLKKLSDVDFDNCASSCSSWAILSSTQSLSDGLSGDKFYDAQETFEVDDYVHNISANMECGAHGDRTSMPKGNVDTEASDTIPTPYTYKFILFRFSDAILPFKLRKIITSDLRLLRLMESGLPSWVIFFQSYPIFSHFYQPWMRPLARSLYILISLVTFIIGFYDLYKNVPLLKAAVPRICGPFFEWIEAHDMISRIRYLGTMLFLQNFEKAIKWLFMMARAIKPMLAVIARPFAEPLAEVVEFISPLWNICVETGEMFSSTLLVVTESLYNAFLDLTEDLFWPFELIYSCICDIGTSIHQICCSFLESLLVPIHLVVALVKHAVSVVSSLYIFLKDVLKSLSSILQVTSFSDGNQGYHEIPVWKELWNDLFSQVFRALRSIINGLSAFFMTCNRHRLSIHNHTQASLWRLAYVARLAPHRCPCRHRFEHHHKVECDHCK